MSAHEINCKWLDGVAFEAEDHMGHKLITEAGPKFGGKNRGFLPKPLLLAALAGCMGVDVISILNKMEITPEYFNVRCAGEMNEEQPRYYHKIHLIYEFKGSNLPIEMLQKAVDVSCERYCNVSALLSKGAVISHEIQIL
jgi:putative redox protein